MGPYCKFCGTRCFVLRVLQDGPFFGQERLLATCRDGMVLDLLFTGHTHLTALNPVTESQAVDALR
jgi:hypothetical protein